MPVDTPLGPILDPAELFELADGACERPCGEDCPGRALPQCHSCFGSYRWIDPEGAKAFRRELPQIVRSIAAVMGGERILSARRAAAEAAAAAAAEAAAAAAVTPAVAELVAQLAPGETVELATEVEPPPEPPPPPEPRRAWSRARGVFELPPEPPPSSADTDHHEGQAPSDGAPE